MEFCGERVSDPNVDLDFVDRSRDVRPVGEGFWFSFCDEMDNEDEVDSDEAEEGDATKDMDRSSGLSVATKQLKLNIFVVFL